MLREVDLEYLVDRKGSMTDEVHWEDVLSLGEKQRYVKCIDLDQVSMLNNASALTNRPGGLASGLHQEVFYVPQKPYNVHGRRP